VKFHSLNQKNNLPPGERRTLSEHIQNRETIDPKESRQIHNNRPIEQRRQNTKSLFKTTVHSMYMYMYLSENVLLYGEQEGGTDESTFLEPHFTDALS